MALRCDTGFPTLTRSVCLALAAWSMPILADTTSSVPGPTKPFHHESAFSTYQPYTESPAASWPTLNETVGRIGGWRAYAQEIYEAQLGAQKPGPGTITGPQSPMHHSEHETTATPEDNP